MKAIGRLVKLMWQWVPNKILFIVAMIFALISKVSWLLTTYVIGQIMNVIQVGGVNMWADLRFWFIILALQPVVNRGFHGVSRYREQLQQQKAIIGYRSYLYKIVSSMPLSRHVDNHSGDTIKRVNDASEGLNQFMYQTHMFVRVIVNFFGSLTMIMLLRPKAIIPMIVIFAVVFTVVRYFDKVLVKISEDRRVINRKDMAILFDFISNMKTLISLRIQDKTRQAYFEHMNTEIPVQRKYVIRNETKRGIMDILIAILSAGLLGWFMYDMWTIQGVIKIGSLTILLGYLDNLRSVFDNITWYYAQIIQRDGDVLGVSSIVDDYKKYDQTAVINAKPTWSSIALKNISFSYGKQNVKQLDNVSLQFNKGQRIALVGESGSGKSTLLSVIRGLYPLDTGDCYIDNTYDKDGIIVGNHSSLVPQEPEIFENTIKYNITMGLLESDDDIHKFATIAQFHEIALSLPQGYDTNIKEKGVNLSGGQKQRLALTRALLLSQNSDIILLDESTSSVDSINEKKIYQNIFTAFPDKTLIAAIHTLHLLPMFDYVYVFDKGKIVEQGKFNNLVEQNGIFTAMWKEYQANMDEE